MSYIQAQEEQEFTHTSVAEWDREEARDIGSRNPGWRQA